MRLFWMIIVGISTTIIFSYSYKSCNTGDYSKDRVRKCIVLDKMHLDDGGKHSHSKLTLILESEGRKFDITVTPTTYYNASIGKEMYFELSERDIKRDSKLEWAETKGLLLCVVGLILSAIFIFILIEIYKNILNNF